MRLRTFSAPTMNEVIALVRDQLGPDAIILSTQTEADGLVRVNAAVEDGSEPAAAADPAGGTTPSEVLPQLRLALAAHGLDETLRDVLLAAALDAGRASGTSSAMILAAALDTCFTFDPLPAREPTKPLLLVGPPGAGKTVTVAKLAARARLAGHSVRVIATDMVKAGGLSQLQQLTEALGIGLRQATDADELHAAIAGCAGGDLIVIDSCGVNPFDRDDMARLASLAQAVAVEPVLVLPAGLDSVDATEIARAFAAIGCRRAIVTRLDLTRRLGSILAAAQTAGLAFADVSVSPTIVDGLRPLNPVSLARLLLPNSTASVAPAEARIA